MVLDKLNRQTILHTANTNIYNFHDVNSVNRAEHLFKDEMEYLRDADYIEFTYT